MSDASRSAEVKEPRRLLATECEVLDHLLHSARLAVRKTLLNREWVLDLNDGGMGSIRFVRSNPQRYGATAYQGQYRDSDGVPVLVSLHVDEHGDIFELDFWKVDFSRVKHYPSPSELAALSEPDRALFSRSA